MIFLWCIGVALATDSSVVEQAAKLEEGGEEAASALVRTWAARFSVALHRSNAARLRSALGAAEPARQRARDLAAALAN